MGQLPIKSPAVQDLAGSDSSSPEIHGIPPMDSGKNAAHPVHCGSFQDHVRMVFGNGKVPVKWMRELGVHHMGVSINGATADFWMVFKGVKIPSGNGWWLGVPLWLRKPPYYSYWSRSWNVSTNIPAGFTHMNLAPSKDHCVLWVTYFFSQRSKLSA